MYTIITFGYFYNILLSLWHLENPVLFTHTLLNIAVESKSIGREVIAIRFFGDSIILIGSQIDWINKSKCVCHH